MVIEDMADLFIGRTYKSGRKQEMIFSVFGATAPIGYLTGALFSSLLAQLAWWPWVCQLKQQPFILMCISLKTALYQSNRLTMRNTTKPYNPVLKRDSP